MLISVGLGLGDVHWRTEQETGQSSICLCCFLFPLIIIYQLTRVCVCVCFRPSVPPLRTGRVEQGRGEKPGEWGRE